MKLIVGLGNPGVKYKPTRHNLGFMVIGGLSRELDIELYQLKYNSLIGQGELRRKSITLTKPMIYMNRSGRAVYALLKGFKLSLADLIVICDDLNLPLGALRVRAKGSAGGHNGLGSIINVLGSEEFTRLRLGIDRPPPNIDVADYVLEPFTKSEWPTVKEMIAGAQAAVCAVVEQGTDAAMNRFNSSP